MPEVSIDSCKKEMLVDYIGILYRKFKERFPNEPINFTEVKHGEWLEKETFHDENADVISEWQSARCSVCNKYNTTPYLYCFTDYNFCPNCGADMRSNAQVMPSKDGGT